MHQSKLKAAAQSGNGAPKPARGLPIGRLAPDTLRFLMRSLWQDWKCYRKQLRKCQRKLSERSVHDLRVEARRLLSLLDLLANFLSRGRLDKARRALKRHLDEFDDLRDTQVQMVTVRELRGRFSSAREFYRFLKKREARCCRGTWKRARRLRTKAARRVICAARDDVKHWLKCCGSRRADPLLLSAVNDAFSRTKALKENINPADTHSIHCTRVAFKKFRYVIEALGGHFSWASKQLLGDLRQYQTLMGDIQDSEVLLQAFTKFLRKQADHDSAGLRFQRELEKRRRNLIKKYLAAADRLFEFWPPRATAPGVKEYKDGANKRRENNPGALGMRAGSTLKKKTL